MPTKPAITHLNATSAQILNATRNEIGGDYASMVPRAVSEGDLLPTGARATKEDSLASLRGIGNVIMQYQPLQNAFLSALVNRIGRVIITSRLYENPWASFKKGLLEYGETVEEIFVNIAKPHQFDPEVAETEIFKREIPDVRAAFHTMNYQKFYKTTVSNDQLRQAFLSWQGITDLIGKIIDALYTSANYDEFITMKYLISRTALDGNIYPSSLPAVTAENANSIVSSIKGISNVLEFMSTDYNMAGVATYTDKRFQYLILNAKFSAVIDVESLARAFNLSYVDFMGRAIMVDSFRPNATEILRMNELYADDPTYVPFTDAELNQLDNVPAVLVDESWFMIFDNYYNMTEQYNGQGLYWNYWYHVWKTFSVSPFSNAILFTTESPAITSVTVSPATATIAKGSNAKFTATVVATGFAPKQVTWSLTGDSAVTSTIDANGNVSIAAAEVNATLTVTATSTYDATKTGTATITVPA